MQKFVQKIIDLGNQQLIIETGKMAKLANGAALVRLGDTMVLATACASKEPLDGRDFFPLSVEYREKQYAAGRIPGGFFKRETRPAEKEILTARLIDRPLRPLFPDGYHNEVQIFATVISADSENDADVLSINAASAALLVSDIPFNTPLAAVRIAKIEAQYLVNPTFAQVEASTIDIVVAGTRENIIMVEGGAFECTEEEMHQALTTGHEAIKKIAAVMEELQREVGTPKKTFTAPAVDANLKEQVLIRIRDHIPQINTEQEKKKRYDNMDALIKRVNEELAESFPDQKPVINGLIHEFEQQDMRTRIVRENIRIDGRKCDEIRSITCEVGLLPRTHGSALFTRGETQALAVVTLGTALDQQKIEGLQGQSFKTYMLHYNFPPFSVGEVKPVRSTSRREIGHGHLAERAIAPMVPVEHEFPYTIRIVSDILESNGSSSMASVCGGSLAMMDAGVPIKSAVAGIAMGLIKEDTQAVILSDILGTEDHLGDMDFKVTGTRQGITGLQMDIKIGGITPDLMKQALEQARAGRIHILDVMEKTLAQPRKSLSKYAPRLVFMKVPVSKIGEIIGPGGKNIRGLQEETGTTINIEDDGSLTIASSNVNGVEEAKRRIACLIEEPELNKIYKATIKTIQPFGAFAEFLPGKEGLIHISELTGSRVNRVEDVVSIGDVVYVKVIGFEREGKVRLSKAAADRDMRQTPAANT